MPRCRTWAGEMKCNDRIFAIELRNRGRVRHGTATVWRWGATITSARRIASVRRPGASTGGAASSAGMRRRLSEGEPNDLRCRAMAEATNVCTWRKRTSKTQR